MTLKQACNAIMTWVKEKNMSGVDTNVITESEQHDERYNELKDMIQQQNELLKQMTKKMDEQQRYIDERLEKRDQQLMGAIREMQEEKRVLLETDSASQEKKWYKFWK
ncbi:DNA-binding protein [Bacillus pseudomycoides]|uniref:DNA-binding protein n=2 Tax=Bacillus pseudomycoides TaxID=64104 RepID=A0ABD6T5H3_9BACI|nr:DNA-binding protein [Bacillus pseudomycoides]